MKLYYTPGVCSLAAHIVLRETDTPFKLEKVDLSTHTTESGAAFKDVNPKGQVPAFVLDDGEVLTENAAILQLIADQAQRDGNDGAAGLVSAAGSMARVREQELLSFVGSELHKNFGRFFSQVEMDDANKKATYKKIADRLGTLEAMLERETKYLLGDQFTIADAYAFVVLSWAPLINQSLDDWPLVKAYMERVRAREAVQDAMKAEGLLD